MYARPTIFEKRGSSHPRADRTAAVLRATFCELLATRQFREISCGDLADRSGVARSTVYRRWAGLEDLLWQVMRPMLEQAISSALSGAFDESCEAFTRFWRVPNLAASLAHPATRSSIHPYLHAVIASQVERRNRSRDANTCALILTSALLGFLAEHAESGEPSGDQLRELILTLYVAAMMTPHAARTAAGDFMNRERGRFPAAVSARESLASSDYIVSMIDGRPYRSLTRHLRRFNMTPEAYRACFDLPESYPMVAPAYSKARRELALRSLAPRRAAPASAEACGAPARTCA